MEHFRDHGMQTVKVNKDKLVEIMKNNLDQHKKDYREAVEGYKAAYLKEAEQHLALAKAGKPSKFVHSFKCIVPREYSSEYTTVICMLEMSVDQEIVLTQQQFLQYVRDEWNWSGHFNTTKSLYNSVGFAGAGMDMDDDMGDGD